MYKSIKMALVISSLASGICFSLGCQSADQPVNNLRQFSSEDSGTVDGGGGSVLGTKKEDMIEQLMDLRRTLQIIAYRAKFFASKNSSFDVSQLGQSNYVAKQGISIDFLNSPEFAKIILKMKVIMPYEVNCEDKFDNSKDGSADVITQTICLSGYGLSRVPKSVFHAQMVALAVHEIAHLAGATESAAQAIQNDLVIRSSLLYSDRHFFQNDLYEISETISQIDYLVDVNLKNYGFGKGTCSLLAELNGRVGKLDKKFFHPTIKLNTDFQDISAFPPVQTTNWNSEFSAASSIISSTKDLCISEIPIDAATLKNIKFYLKNMRKSLNELSDFIIKYDDTSLDYILH